MKKLKPHLKNDTRFNKSAGLKGIWKKVQANTFKSFLLACLFVIVIGYTIYELLRYDFVIEPFEMPFQLGRQGYTSTVVAHRLQHYMKKRRNALMQAEKEDRGYYSDKENAISMSSDKNVTTITFSELEKRQRIEVPGLGLSLNTVIEQLQYILGIKLRRVAGNVVVRGGKLYLTLRITGQPDVTFSGENDYDPEPVIKKAAEQVVKTFEPLRVGLSYCLNQNDEALEKLIKYRQKTRDNDKSKEVVTLTLEACLLKNLKNQEAFDKALDKLAQAEKYDWKNSIVFYMKGNTLQSYGDYINENHRSTSFGTLKSLMLTIINSSYDEAIFAYQTAIIYEPKNGGIYVQWARTLIKKANQLEDNALKQTLLEKAFAKYQIASKKDPKNPWVYTDWGYQLAKVYHQSSLSEKMFEKAEEKFRKAIDVDPYYALAYAIWGDVLLKFQENYQDEAIRKYEKAVELNLKVAWLYGNWGVALFNQKKYQAAIVKFETATILKDEAWFYYLLGNALVKLKQYKEAIVQYENAVALAPEKREMRRYYYAWGGALSQLGQYEKAIIRYQKALAIEPEHIWSHIFMGYAYVKVQKPDEAFTECETVLKSPNARNYQKAAAHALCGLAEIGLKHPESAIEQCQTALTISEREDWAYLCLGDALVLLNKLEEAVIQYEKAANLKPEKAFYYYKWGQALAKSEKNEAAIMQYEKAMAFDSGGNIRKQAQVHIEALRQ